MKLIFKLRFHTRPGQSLWLTGNHAILGSGEIEKAVPLEYFNEEFWQTTIEFPADAAQEADVAYHYVLRDADGWFVYDWGRDKVINPPAFTAEEVLIIDSWNHAGFYENAFYTEPFQQILLRGDHTEVRTPAPAKATHTFKVKAPLLTKGQTLCVLGNTAALGQWNTNAPVLLNRTAGEDFLSVKLDLGNASFPIEYKYGVYDVAQKVFVRYEEGGNRVLRDTIAANKYTVVNDGFAGLPANTWKGAGVAIPVFSLRSEKSFGVGEFADLNLLADWCRQTGLKLIQILPVNDTTATHRWTDCYPYSAISAFALHPLYLNLSQVATGRNRRLLEALEEERKRLNALDAMDYEAVIKTKLAFIRRIYPSQRQKTFRSAGYRRFFEQNQQWLVPYAVFCHLRDQHGTPDFTRWPEHRNCRPEDIAALAAENSAAYDDIALNYFLQYHLHLQLRQATEYAHAQGIILKGDIPIGVSRCGTDAWQQPELYHLDVQAGAPPDAFAVKGQNWGFPTYNWQRMKDDGFAWWKRRFEQMSCYFDAFRIDHILGFFRIWSIPAQAVEGIMGYFVPAIPVRASEFAARGITGDRERYTRPYITAEILRERFGGDADLVKYHFLKSDPAGRIEFKPEFATQRQVQSFFAHVENSRRNEQLKFGLYDLISNVILFLSEASPDEFHFRFEMEKTSSFKNLDPRSQAQLRDLYVDYFFRRQDDFWRKEAMQKLPALKRATNMLVCGEDLGLVPACVPDVMRQLGLLSLEVQRMPKDSRREFFRPAEAPYLSVVTPSTHDMSTIRGWWEEDRARTQRFYNRELERPGDAPKHCEPWISQSIVIQHLSSPAMWSIFQLQDLLGMDERLRRKNPEDERINEPADSKHYWRYRMHLSLEQLLLADAFNHELKKHIQQSGR